MQESLRWGGKMAAIYPENIPPEAKNLNQWDCYKLEMVDGDKTKVPYSPATGQRASSTDAQTWTSFNAALAAYQDLEIYDGICFFVTEEVGIVFIDLDKCIQDDIIAAWAAEIVKRFGSYTEKSQSGKGLHILIKGKKPGKRCSTAKYPHGVEIYDHARQCCLTGDLLEGHSTIEPRQDALNELYRDIFGEDKPQPTTTPAPGLSCLSDQQVIERATLAKNGSDFDALWHGSTLGHNGDESAADLALMNPLAFYSGGDRRQMERLFSASVLGQRDKWISRQDYRERTIEKALEGRTEFYKPRAEETEAERIHRLHAEANPPLLRADADRFEAAHPGCKIFNCDDDPKPDEISEEDLNALPRAENPVLKINLEPDNLISIYMKYGAKTCDAYPEYHYTSALSLLSISTNRNLVLRLSQDTLYPNIWAMNLGKTTVSRKSAAMGKYSRFADDLFPLSALPQSYSPEGLLEELTEKPKGYLVKDEAAAMIEAMEKNYMLEMRDIYCILYDCKGYRRKIRSSQRTKLSEYGATDPYINILCATTPEAFSKHTSLIDLTSGWLLRFIYTFPTYKKPYMHFKPMSDEDQTAYAEVLGRLSHLKGLLYNRADVINIGLEPSAWTYYQAWQEQRESELVDTGDDIQLAFFGRLAFTALKMAILFTVGRADYTEETNVSLVHIQEACRQADSYFIPIGRIIADFVAMDETNNLQEKVLATLGRNSSRLKWTKLMQKTHADKDKLEKAVAALVESEEVSDINVKSKGHKPARWILLKDINKTRSKTLKTIRYAETKDNKDSNDSKNTKDTKDSSNSGDVPGIHGIFAKKAIFASFAIHGSLGEEPSLSVDEKEEVEGIPPASSPHPEPTPSKLKAIYVSEGPALEYASFSLNLHNRCSHDCQYCYAKKRFIGTCETRVKKSSLANIESDLKKWQGERKPVHLTFQGDPYDLGRQDNSEVRAVLQLFRKYQHPFQVLTRGGTKAVQDFDLYGPNDRFGVTLTFINDVDSLKWEPGAALPGDRIEALRQAHERGIKTWVSMEPVIDPAQTLALIEATHDFVDHYGVGKWNHDQRANEIDWPKFRADAEAILQKYGKSKLIKADLMKAAPSPARKEDPGLQKFKAGMKKRTCLQCGEHFSYDLGIHWQGGFICARCHREGPPNVAIEPPKADAQARLGEVA
ncbi:MAG: DUF3987 domain-containing protein [Methanothrix sp.]|nr:MAG: DUF3987 domain-containing protein [Methanothrix sp.]